MMPMMLHLMTRKYCNVNVKWRETFIICNGIKMFGRPLVRVTDAENKTWIDFQDKKNIYNITGFFFFQCGISALVCCYFQSEKGEGSFLA